MRVTTSTEPATTIKGDVLILPLGDNKTTWPRTARAVDKKLKGRITAALADNFFSGKEGKTHWIDAGGALGVTYVLLVGLGKNGEPDELQGFYQAAAAAGRELRTRKIRRACWYLQPKPPCARQQSQADAARKVADELTYAQYTFTRYKSGNEEKPSSLRAVTLVLDSPAKQREVARAARIGVAQADGANVARDLGNTPGNDLPPAQLAARARAIARQGGFRCRVLDEKELRRRGFDALCGVARGSRQPAKLIILEYRKGRRADAPVVLVGKGVTFDTGGISLKPGADMDEMKFDMCGAAAVLGAFHTVAALKLKINLVGVIPSVENMPGGDALKPGDVLTALSGKTIEVLNTDAEGRLILADALTYAKRFKPAVIVDLATLTGAVVIALGHHATGLMATDKNLKNALMDAGRATGDRVWPLPLWKAYSEQIKGVTADIANIGGRPGGAITAAAFLKEFVDDDQPWAHLDIAGTAWTGKHATGVGVRLLTQWLMSRS